MASITSTTTAPAAPGGYTALQILLHWGIAVLLVFQIVSGGAMEDLGRAIDAGLEPAATVAFMANAHIAAGFLVILLAAVRLAVRVRTGVPAPIGNSAIGNRIAAVVHGAFYVLMFYGPVSGAIAYFVTSAAAPLHMIVKPVTILLLVLHVAGALLHGVLRDGTMRRMIRPGG